MNDNRFEEPSQHSPLKPRVLPADYSWIVFRSSWRLLGSQYPLLMTTIMIVMISNLVLSRISFVGPIIASILSAFFAPGVCLIVRSIVDGRTLPLKTLFTGFQEDEITSRILPYVIASAGLSLVFSVLEVFGPSSKEGNFQFGLFIIALSFIWSVLVAFSMPLMVFKKVRFVDTIELNINALTSNLVFFLLYLGCMMCVLLATTIAFFLPVLFVGVPMLSLSYYMVYACLFEGLQVENIGPKTAIQSPPTQSEQHQQPPQDNP